MQLVLLAAGDAAEAGEGAGDEAASKGNTQSTDVGAKCVLGQYARNLLYERSQLFGVKLAIMSSVRHCGVGAALRCGYVILMKKVCLEAKRDTFRITEVKILEIHVSGLKDE